jgi:hypothetical protein
MKRSIEDTIKLIALKQPIPTVLKRPESTEESLTGGGSTTTLCGVTIPIRYLSLVQQTYATMVDWMYCRPHPIPGGGCNQLSLGPPAGDGSMPADQWVTDRDKPLSWQRMHPDFNPDDPATWGSLFNPGGFVDRELRYYLAYAGEDGQYGTGPLRPGVTQADIDAQIEIIRQLYIARCSFAVAQTGACCKIAGDFGGFICVPTTGAECDGNFYPGKSCGDIGGDNCGLARNPIQQSNQVKRPKEIMDMVMSMIKKK